ncbi:cytochrome P450 [Nocardia sp. CDC160]|uniref:cytochrome P450 n=1 Tax=Nocardia sp. CDC160 TaxID=3112166 RepID=UPI002DBE04F7|nr:cytochrome P450 [Nocardia sp. CDC160]MEC3918400.1 cytochrome P450 [Nocardia sp. CDC160]MEC3919137.1 cytochrome P450 [Nocardia sp. CDC160]
MSTNSVTRPRSRRRVSTFARSIDPMIPGPKGRPLLGVLPEFRRDPFESVRGWAREYGDVFHVPLPMLNVVMVNHPELAATVLNDRDGNLGQFGRVGELVARVTGATMPIMEGDALRQRRRLLRPMFGRRHLAVIAESIVAEFTRRIERWDRFADTGEVVDLQAELMRVTLPGFLRAMYATELTETQLAHADIDIRLILRTLASGVFLSPPTIPLPIPGTENLPKSFRRLYALVDGLIEQRLADPAEHHDILGLLLASRYEDGTGLSHRDLRMELITLMGGGYETMVASMSHTLAHLALNPEPAQRLYDEIDELDGAAPTYDDLARLTWARACFDEGQRLQGHPMNPRFAWHATELAGFHIPAGTVVGVPVYTLHRDQRWWRDPDRYDPTRFTDTTTHPPRPGQTFIPFGAGPHHCLGSALAYLNAQFLLTPIFQRYRLHTPPGWTPRHASTFSITLDGGLPVHLTKVRDQVRTSRTTAAE